MSDFPSFFAEHAVLPSEVDDPNYFTAEEQDWLDLYEDWSNASAEPEHAAGPNVDFAQPGPALWVYPWISGHSEPGGIVDLDLSDLDDVLAAGESHGEGPPGTPSGRFSRDGSPGIDAIAAYWPWHFHGDGWGICFYASVFRDFVQDLAYAANQPISVIEPWAFRQVLEHEWTHFEFEVVGTELDRLLRRPCYRTYLLRRFGQPTHWSSGPLEEAVATWREIQFARLRKPKRPAGYVKAVREFSDASPPGYRDWRCMQDRRREDLVLTTIESLIVDERLWTARFRKASSKEVAQVPVRWWGDSSLIPRFARPKSLARPTVRQLKKWLKKNGATITVSRGKGSHEQFCWNGCTGGYATSRPVVPKDESQRIAQIFGLGSVRELYEAIANGRVIAPRASP